jgi:hypothetical protein
MGCTKQLLLVASRHANVTEKVFGVFYSFGLTLSFFLRHCELLHSSEELQLILLTSFADVVKPIASITIECFFSSAVFEEHFSLAIKSLFSQSNRVSDIIWATHLQTLAKPGDISNDPPGEPLTPSRK